MKEIRFIQIGNNNTLNGFIYNLVANLNVIQKEYTFVFENDVLNPIAKEIVDVVRLDSEKLEHLVKSFMLDEKNSEYPIGITDMSLEDDYFTITGPTVSIITTYDYQSYCKYTLYDLVLCSIVYILAQHIDTEAHLMPCGCPNDACDNPADINFCLEKSEFCEPCTKKILSAVELGKMTIKQVAAINRILDVCGKRKICFVLMPFKDKFDSVYSVLKEVITEAGYVCVRADEIFKPGSILNVIIEMIERADLIIADLTDRNPNVFYELGYAHAIGKNTILLTQKTSDVPFDIRHRRYIRYDVSDDILRTFKIDLLKYFT